MDPINSASNVLEAENPQKRASSAPALEQEHSRDSTYITSEQRAEIEEMRARVSPTRRATVQELEEILYKDFRVLGRGFLRVIDYMGDDGAIVQAARVSYGRGTKKVHQDRALIGYLMRHHHTTPFEMCEIKFHVKLPIFVARQWIRHRTANVNEYSARYSVLDREFYIPEPENLAAQSRVNRQGRGEVLTGEEAEHVLHLLRNDAARCYEHYTEMLNEDEQGNVIDPARKGLARELARMNLTLNTFTQWYWKIDLHNLMHFLSLRADEHAQYEIRAYADVIQEQVLKRWLPLTYAAFKEYRKEGKWLTVSQIKYIIRLIAGEKVTRADSGMGDREWRELRETFDLKDD